MDKPKATPKDFFLWAGAMVTLYAGVFAFVGLLFDYINYTFPDTALQGYYGDPFQGSISYEMASLIVLAPVFLMLMRLIRRDIAHDPSRNEIWVRRWALFLTLFVAGATIVIDLIVLITTFLQGEDLSVRFLLKVLVVLLVASAGFMHFMADLWGYWVRNPQYARYINWAVGGMVLFAIVAGFIIVGSPQSQRKLRIDQQRVQDLQSLQSQVVYIYQQKGRLPASLSELSDPLSYYTVPVDPESKQSYTYRVTAPLSFELCATFSAAGSDAYGPNISRPVMPMPEPVGLGGGKYGVMQGNWQHEAGEQCFTRTIDTQLYPIYPKQPTP